MTKVRLATLFIYLFIYLFTFLYFILQGWPVQLCKTAFQRRQNKKSNAVVTPLRKAALCETRRAILGIWGDTWLTRGKYGIYVVVTGPLRGLRDAFCT